MSLFSFGSRRLVVEFYEIDGLAGAVLRNLEQVDDARESGAPGERGGDVVERDLPELVDDDMSRTELVLMTHAHVRPPPDADADRDFAALDRRPQPLRELHA